MKYEIHTLQILRGIAALLVVTNHLWGRVFGGIFEFNGGLGVDIFFVLSGFLMVFTQTNNRNALTFIFGRIKRIYPLYIIISLPIILMLVNLDGVYKVASNFLLLPTFGKYHHILANNPSWTLVYEMIFYVFFAFALIFSRDATRACLITVSIICISIYVTVNIVGTEPRYGWIHLGYILGDPLMLDFAAGGILALIYKHLRFPAFIDFRVFMIATIIILYLAINVIESSRMFKFGIPALIIIIFAIYTKEGAGGLYRTMHLIGDASYSIYLSHIYFVYIIKSTMIANQDSTLMTNLSVLLTTVLCVMAGIFINRSIEKPIIIFLAKKPKTPLIKGDNIN
jgi:peptidoglycan/LPS O-acetylase OafA/YrhL